MKKTVKIATAGVAALVWASSAAAQFMPQPRSPVEPISAFDATVRTVEQMAFSKDVQKLLAEYKEDDFRITNVAWEDTGRSKNSSWGPNISDMTIQVQVKDSKGDIARMGTMPMFRYGNFHDKTTDLSPNDFFLKVGNEKGKELKQVSLTDYLFNLRSYLSNASEKNWPGSKSSLLSLRDDKVLVSAQVSFLPIPKGEDAEVSFNPAIFNYQSWVEKRTDEKGKKIEEKHPAVLAIVATSKGTSATIIDNERSKIYVGRSGQRLFFNNDGGRASFTGKRLSEVVGKAVESSKETTLSQNAPANQVLLIQVPLKNKAQPRRFFSYEMAMMSTSARSVKSASDVEDAVIGFGDVEGKFTEIDGVKIERDERFPIRVTVQYYKATSNGKVAAADIHGFKSLVDSVLENGESVGSLVTEGETGRVTEHSGPKYYHWHWWPRWPVYFSSMTSEAKLIEACESKWGKDWSKILNGATPEAIAAALAE